MVALHTLKKIVNPTYRLSWGILAVACTALLLIALYFQYSLGMEPCIKCVYQRAAVCILLCSFILGYTLYAHTIARILAYLISSVTLCKAILLSIEHSLKQKGTDPLGSCGIKPNFPDFAQLDKWVPAIFEVRGTCDTINWVFLTLTMPQWLTIAYSFIGLYLCAMLASEHDVSKDKNWTT